MARATPLVLALALALCSVSLAQPQALPGRAALPKALPAKKTLPAKKVPVRRLPPVQVNCQVANQNPPFRVVTCKFKSRLQVPVCPRFTCSPAPPANCNTGPGAGGISNQACSWSITRNCSIPAPVYPSRGNEWGFGYIFTEPGPVSVQLQSFQRVGFLATKCP